MFSDVIYPIAFALLLVVVSASPLIKRHQPDNRSVMVLSPAEVIENEMLVNLALLAIWKVVVSMIIPMMVAMKSRMMKYLMTLEQLRGNLLITKRDIKYTLVLDADF